MHFKNKVLYSFICLFTTFCFSSCIFDLIFQKKSKGSKAKKARQCSPEADDPSLCFHCKQKLDDNANLVFFENPPEGAKDEFEALFDPSLNMADMYGGGGGGGCDDGKGSKLLILITSKNLDFDGRNKVGY